MLNLILFGPPGSGKGTQAEKLIDKYNLKHISTGDLLRAEVAAQTELGVKAKAIMDKGELVSDEIVIGMIENKLKEGKLEEGYIFDGFPRTVDQARALRNLLTDHGMEINLVVALQVDKEELIKRLLKRGEESGRTDDNLETITNRINVYENQTKPVTRYYGKRKLYQPIDGVGTIEEIFLRILAEIEKVEH